MTGGPGRPLKAGRATRRVAIAALAGAIVILGGTLMGLGPTPGVPLSRELAEPAPARVFGPEEPEEPTGPITFSEAATSATQADIDPATLLPAGDSFVGVNASRYGNVSLFRFARIYPRRHRQIVCVAAPAPLGENRVYGCESIPGVSVLFGTTRPGIVRVTVAHPKASGGEVTDGAWLVVVEGNDDVRNLGWSFLRADGSVARQGTGVDDPRATPGP